MSTAESQGLPVRLWFGIFLSTAVLLLVIWSIYPSGPRSVDQNSVITLIGFSLVPLMTLAWATFTPFSWRHQANILRRLVQASVFLTACFTLVSCLGPHPLLKPLTGMGYFGLLGASFLLTSLVLLALLPRDSEDEREISKYRWRYIFVVCGAMAALFVWSYVNIGIVVMQAEKLSSGRPYCLQVTADNFIRYKPLTSLHELSGLDMQSSETYHGGSGSLVSTFHSILIVEKEGGFDWYNWSYRQQGFTLPKTESHMRHVQRPACTPRVDYFRSLSFW